MSALALAGRLPVPVAYLRSPSSKPAAFLIAALLAVAAPHAVAAQDGAPQIGISPALIGESDPTFGVRGTLDWAVGDDPTDLRGTFALDVPLTLDADDNPESLEATLSVTTLILDLSGADLTGAPGEEGPDRGALRLGIELGAEAPQQLDNADLAVGLTAVYDHASLELWFVPGLELAYDLAACVGCDVADSDDNRFHRLDLRADWSILLDGVMPVDGFRVRPAGRWFHAWGVGPSLSAFRDDEGLWGRIQLAYHTELDWLHEVYLSWRGGDLPVRLVEERAWSIGVTLIL